MIDKTNTRFGRFRPWLVAGLPMAVLAIWMLFMAGPGITGLQILGWLILGFLGQSMASMAHVAWAARVAPDYKGRSRVFAWWQAFTVIGMLLALSMPILASRLFGLDHGAGVKAIGWFVVLTLPVSIAIAVLVMREPPSPPNHNPPHWRQYLPLLKRGSVVRLLLVDIAIGTGPVLAGTLFFTYFFAIRGYERSDAGALLLVYFFSALLAAGSITTSDAPRSPSTSHGCAPATRPSHCRRNSPPPPRHAASRSSRAADHARRTAYASSARSPNVTT
jgi:Na+/melibiose symporter-like transporter